MTDQSDGSMTPSPPAGSDSYQWLSNWLHRTGRRLRIAFWHWSEQWPFSHVVMFAKALPLLALWLALPVALFWYGSNYRAAEPVRELAYHSFVRTERRVHAAGRERLTLVLAYPRRLFLDSPDRSTAPLAVWLLSTTLTPDPASALRPAMTQTAQLARAGTGTPPATASAISTPTPNLYVVRLDASGDGVSFTDKDGIPILPQIELTPASFQATPAVLYIRPAQETTARLPAWVRIDAYVDSPRGGVLGPTPLAVPVALESTEESRARRLCETLTETATLVVALVAALVGFAVQQWNDWRAEEQEKEQAELKRVLAKINRLHASLGENLSTGARLYLGLLKETRPVWYKRRVRDHLQETWWMAAPSQLRLVVDLVMAQDEGRLIQRAKEMGAGQISAALEWAYERLDEDWQLRLLEITLVLQKRPEFREVLPGALIEDIEQRPWHALLRAWPHLSLWRDIPFFVDADVEAGLRFLGVRDNPFGSERAETDTLLLQCRMYPMWVRDLNVTRSAVAIGATGAGKTATSLLLTYESLRDHDVFPVYYPVKPEATTLRAKMDGVARALAKTLLPYLTVRPREFLGRDVAGRAAIVHLFARYIGTDGSLMFPLYQAGLPQVGDGLEMSEEIERLTKGVSFTTSIADDELLTLMSGAFPRGFRHTLILVDVQETDSDGAPVSSEYLRLLLNLVGCLAPVGVFIKVFLPEVFQDPLRELGTQLPAPAVLLEWSDSALLELLKKRLAQLGEDSLAAWCDPEARRHFPDERLVSAAQGRPGGLIKKGNTLLRRIGQTQHSLTVEDLNEILGPLSGVSG